MLLGAAFVVIGVLAAALADRIRGLRVARPQDRATRSEPIAAPEISHARGSRGKAPEDRIAIPIISQGATIISQGPTTDREKTMGTDVVAALVGAGYKKYVAHSAAWSCDAIERASVEAWTRAALRRASQGVSP